MEKWQEELEKCVKCGTCQNACPVFKETLDEATVARGKLSIVENWSQGKFKLTHAMEEKIFRCLACNHCEAQCPNSVKATQVFLQMKKKISKKYYLPFLKEFILRAPFPLFRKLSNLFGWMVFKKIPSNLGLLLRFSQNRLVPKFAPVSFIEAAAKFPKLLKPKMKVGFFTGCLINYVYPQIGFSVMQVLAGHNIQLIIPPQQKCCGSMAFSAGEIDLGDKLLAENLEIFDKEKVEIIITACASCGGNLKRMSNVKICDISEFLVDYTDYQQNLLPVKKKVVYHDPCHLIWKQNIKDQPRQLIKAVPDIEFIELPAGECCGFGGLFNVLFYDLSCQINDKRVQQIKQANPDFLLTGCPACQMQLTSGFYRNNLDLPIYHTVDLLDMSMKGFWSK